MCCLSLCTIPVQPWTHSHSRFVILLLHGNSTAQACLNGLGSLILFTHKPVLQQNKSPIVHPLQNVPLTLGDSVIEELHHLLPDGIMMALRKPCNTAMMWCGDPLSTMTLSKLSDPGLLVSPMGTPLFSLQIGNLYYGICGELHNVQHHQAFLVVFYSLYSKWPKIITMATVNLCCYNWFS